MQIKKLLTNRVRFSDSVTTCVR